MNITSRYQIRLFVSKIIFTVLATCGLISFNGNAQITVTPGGTAASIVNTLVSNGIQVSNMTLNCDALAYGTWSGNLQAGGTQMSNGGIVLTTGSALGADGPNASGSTSTIVNGFDFTDPNLTTQPGAGTPPPNYDNCVLEFDMVPSCSTFNISFVFGSEEYPEFVTGSFNDGFGIFISGPNPGGGTYNNYNMARLPNGSLVSIDNVNTTVNSSYYNTNPSNGVMQYDGYTDGLTAQLNVVICSTYHVKIIIADAGDQSWDSGLFLGASSFNCATPVPSITINTVAPICSGQTVTLTATPTIAGGTYLWSPGGATTQSITVSPTTTTVYSCTYTQGCSSAPATSTVTVTGGTTPTFNQVPAICSGGSFTLPTTSTNSITGSWSPAINNTATTVYTFTPNPNQCAAPTTMTVTVNPLPVIAVPPASMCLNTSATLNASGANTYSWTPSATLSASTGTSVTATPATTTTYTISGTAASGCIGSTTSTVTVNPLPTVTANSPTVCAGGTVTLSGGGASTYTWTGGVTNGTAFSPASSGTYTVTGTSAAGCTNTAVSTVTVNPLPTVVANDVSVCSTGTTPVTASGANTYTWSPATYLSATTGSSVTFTPGITATYTVTGTSLAGCVNTDPVTVTVLANAPINAGLDQTICTGSSATLTASGGTSYNWVGLGTNASYSVSPTATTTYTLNGSNASGCTGTDQITVFVNPLPTVTVNNPTVCANATATVTATPTPAGSYNYAWTVPVGAPAPGNVATFSATVSGTYSVVITGIGTNCSSLPASGTVTINPNPTVTVNSPTVCAGSSAAVVATPGVAGSYNYAWSVPAGATNPGNISNFNATVNGTYSVVITNPTTNCASTASSGLVTINPNPVITLTPADPNTCNGTDGSILVNGTGNGSVTWTGAASSSTSGVNLPYTIPSLGAGNYNVTFTVASTGCTSSTVVTVLNNPNAPIINALPNLTTCGTPITLNESIITGTNLSTNVGFFSSPNGVGPIADGTTFNSPTAATTIYVYDVNGPCSAQISFTVTVNVVPTVSVNSPTYCGSTPATLTAVPVPAGPTYSYAWTVPSGATNPGNSATFNTGVNGNYGVIITNTTTNCVSTSASGTVTINPNPTVTVNSSAVCAGSPATVTATPAPAGTYNYAWTVPAGAAAPGNVATFTSTTAGTYSVIITNPTTTCFSTSASGTVTVNPLPTATIAGTVTLCQNQPQPTVTFTGANGSAPYTFTYTLNGGANQTINSTGSTATISVPTSAAGTFTYTLVSVKDASSTACTQAQAGVATITVNPLPTATVTGSAQVCEGGASQTVTFTGANGTAPYTFTYNINNGPSQTITSTGNTATITVQSTTPGVFNYNLVSVRDASTTACSQTQTGTATVTINALPNVFAGNNIPICAGQTVTLTGSGANIYTWDNGVTNGVAFNPPAGTTTFTVVGTSTAGCIDSDQVDVTVNPIPVVSFLPDVTLGCSPLTVNFTNTTANSSNCVWSMSDGTVLTGCGTVTNTFEQAGCYDITLTTTSTNGCSNTFTAANVICVEGPPNTSFSPSANQISEFNTEVEFENNTTGASSYSWNFGTGASDDVSTEENPSYDYEEEEIGYYTVTLIATSPVGCKDTATSVIQIYEELLFYIPNTFTPDYDNFNQFFTPVFTSGYDPYDYSLFIYNRWGEVIFESHNAEIGWNGSYGNNGDIEMIQDGVYTWKIEFKVTKNDERKVVVGHLNLLR